MFLVLPSNSPGAEVATLVLDDSRVREQCLLGAHCLLELGASRVYELCCLDVLREQASGAFQDCEPYCSDAQLEPDGLAEHSPGAH